MRAGVIAALLANINRKQGSAPYDWYDFLPSYGSEPPDKTPDDLLSIVEVLNAYFGGDDLRDNEAD